MADDKVLRTELVVETGASEANIKGGIVGPLGEVDAAGEKAAGTVTAAAQQIESATSGAADSQDKLAESQDGVAKSADAMGKAGAAAGKEIAKGAEAAKDGIAEIPPAADKAKDAIEGMGDAGKLAALPMPDLKRGIMDVSTAAKNMADSVGDAWKAEEEGGRISALQVGSVAQNHVRLKEAIIAQHGSLEAADAPTRATYEAWDTEVQRLISHTANLQDAQQTATRGLKDSGDQIAMVAQIAEQMGRQFGEAGAQIGAAAGSIGMLAAMSSQLKSTFEGLKLNELGGSATKSAIQIGLVVGAFTAASAAGLKMAEANQQNAETIESVEKAIKKLFSGDESAGWFGRMQAGLQVLLSDLVTAATAVGEFMTAFTTGEWEKAKEAIHRLGNSFNGFASEVDAAQRAQVRQREASKLATQAHDAETSALHKTIVALRDATDANKGLDAAKRTQLGVVARLADEINKEITAREHAAAAAGKETSAGAASSAGRKAETAAVGELLTAIAAATVASGDHRTAIELAITAVQHETEATKGLTESELKHREAIIAVAKEIDTAAKAEEHLATVRGMLLDATTALIAAVNEQTGAIDAQQTPIEKQIAALEEQLAANEDLTASDKARFDEMVRVASQIDELQKKEVALTEVKTASAVASRELAESDGFTVESREALARGIDAEFVAWSQLNDEMQRSGGLAQEATEAEQQLYVVKANQTSQIQADIEAKRQQLIVMQDQAKANEAIKTSVAEVTGAWEDGRLVISNISKDAAILTDNVTKAGAAEKDAAAQIAADKQFWDEFDKAIATAGGTTLPRFNQEITVTATAVDRVKMAEHAADVLKAHAAYNSLADEAIPKLNTGLDSLIAKANEAVKAFNAMGGAINHAANAGEGASN